MKWTFHPATRQRWARFRRLRRGWWSFWILLGAYAVSLFSEWIANDKPLWIRHGGRHYFPVLRFYPEDAFTGSGRMTRPDYKALANDGLFDPANGSRALWPPIRHGPLEIISPASIELPEDTIVVATPEARVAAADVDREGRVARTSGMAEFFGLATGNDLGAAWPLPENIRAGLAARFDNRPAREADAKTIGADGRAAWLSLSPDEPRGAAPSRVRLTFREELDARAARTARINEARPVWPPGFPEPGAEGWTFATRKEQVRFPFRPTTGHPLGIDSSGRDVAARMIYALRTSLTFGMALVLATMALGTAAGAVQGYCGGRVDLLGQRFIEVWESLPFLYVLILLGSVYGRSLGLLLAAYAVFNWIGISYYVRAEFLRLRKLPFVEAARVIGLPPRKIVFRHMLPNALVPLVTFFPFSLVGAIGAMAALDYLGFGLPPPTPSWGELLSQAQEFPRAWWLALYPSLALFATMLAGVFVGEGLRAAFDPRTFGRME